MTIQRILHNHLRLRLTRLTIGLTTLLAIGLLDIVVTPPARASFIEQVWNQLFSNSPPRPRRATGSRGDGDAICPIAPLRLADASGSTSSTPIVWSEQPILIWQGTTQWVELRRYREDTPIWSHAISEADRVTDTIALTDRATYYVTAPEPLQPEQRYEWRIYQSPNSYEIVRFQTASVEERDRIAQRLSPSTNILQRADDFAGQQLWSDFWQTLLSSEQPLPPELVTLNSNVVATLCPILSADSSISPSTDGSATKDYFFDGEANQTIELSLETQDAEMQFTLLDPEGKEIGTGTAQPDRPVFQLFTLPAQGKYTVQVRSGNTQIQNRYALTIMNRFNIQ